MIKKIKFLVPLIGISFLYNCGNSKECNLILNLSNCVALNVKNSYREREDIVFQIKADYGYTLPDITKIQTIGITNPFNYELNEKETIANLSFKIYNNAAIFIKAKNSVKPSPTPRPGVYHRARFLSYTGDLLQEVQVEEGHNPIYTGSTPTKEATIEKTFTFSHWNPYELPTYLPKPIIEDTDFRPEFIEEIRQYNFIFNGTNCNIGGKHKVIQPIFYSTIAHFQITHDDGKYKLPDTIIVKRNGVILTPGIDYTYKLASATAHLTIKILGMTEVSVITE